MARKAKSIVSVTPTTIPFGGSGTVVYSTSETNPWAQILVYTNGYVGLDTRINLSKGQTFIIGGTPSWSGGAGEGVVNLFVFKNGVMDVIATNTFTVTA